MYIWNCLRAQNFRKIIRELNDIYLFWSLNKKKNYFVILHNGLNFQVACVSKLYKLFSPEQILSKNGQLMKKTRISLRLQPLYTRFYFKFLQYVDQWSNDFVTLSATLLGINFIFTRIQSCKKTWNVLTIIQIIIFLIFRVYVASPEGDDCGKKLDTCTSINQQVSISTSNC